MQFIDVKNVVFGYGIEDENESPKIVLKDLSLSVKKGEFVSIIGPSGCGKSTLLSIISGLEDKTEGKILVEEEEKIDVLRRSL